MTGAAEAGTMAIVGAGQAGAWIARTLRDEGYAGRIVLIGAEAHPPYERPPLSKAVLAGTADAASVTLLTADDLRARAIELWSGALVTELDPDVRVLGCADGRTLSYDHLFLTTGSRPRVPDWFVSSPHMHLLRSLDDASRLGGALRSGAPLVIVGGGWIGLEVAATARALGVPVLLLEAADRLCRRSVPAPVSAWLRALHEARGVDVRTDVRIVNASEHGDGVTLHLEGGETVSAANVLVGIGNAPEDGLAVTAGLRVQNGIVVDDCGRTSDMHISAAGDVTSFHCRFVGAHARRESWANAQNQAIVAAKAVLGHTVSHAELPWIWSDQYGFNIQLAGVPEAACSVKEKPIDPHGARCWAMFDRDDRLIGAVSANAPRDLRVLRKYLQQPATQTLPGWATEQPAITAHVR